MSSDKIKDADGVKVFLFLYPIVDYVEPMVDFRKSIFERKRCHFSHINSLITARYRNKGYKIFWLYFAGDHPDKPDIDAHHRLIRKQPGDGVLSCGITHDRLTNQGVYPQCDLILDKLPVVNKLVIGGYHQRDCCDRIARVANECGIHVVVDEDVTDFFFITTSLHGKIPLHRKSRIMPRYKFRFAEAMLRGSSGMLDVMIEHRRQRPWLEQIVVNGL